MTGTQKATPHFRGPYSAIAYGDQTITCAIVSHSNGWAVQYPEPAHRRQCEKAWHSLSLWQAGPWEPATQEPSELGVGLGGLGLGGAGLGLGPGAGPLPPHFFGMSLFAAKIHR